MLAKDATSVLTSLDTLVHAGSSMSFLISAGTLNEHLHQPGVLSNAARPDETHFADLRYRECLPFRFCKVFLIQRLAFPRQYILESVRRIVCRSLASILFLKGQEGVSTIYGSATRLPGPTSNALNARMSNNT